VECFEDGDDVWVDPAALAAWVGASADDPRERGVAGDLEAGGVDGAHEAAGDVVGGRVEADDASGVGFVPGGGWGWSARVGVGCWGGHEEGALAVAIEDGWEGWGEIGVWCGGGHVVGLYAVLGCFRAAWGWMGFLWAGGGGERAPSPRPSPRGRGR